MKYLILKIISLDPKMIEASQELIQRLIIAIGIADELKADLGISSCALGETYSTAKKMFGQEIKTLKKDAAAVTKLKEQIAALENKLYPLWSAIYPEKSVIPTIKAAGEKVKQRSAIKRNAHV